MSKKSPRPWTIKIQDIEPGEALWSGEADPLKKEIWLGTNAPRENRPAVLAHEIAHAKLDRYPAKTNWEQDLREARADAYAYIKGWAGARGIEQIVEDRDEDWIYEGLRWGAQSLLRRRKITPEEYKEFIQELEEVPGYHKTSYFSKEGRREQEEWWQRAREEAGRENA